MLSLDAVKSWPEAMPCDFKFFAGLIRDSSEDVVAWLRDADTPAPWLATVYISGHGPGSITTVAIPNDPYTDGRRHRHWQSENRNVWVYGDNHQRERRQAMPVAWLICPIVNRIAATIFVYPREAIFFNWPKIMGCQSANAAS
jgi:hypothetical protein